MFFSKYLIINYYPLYLELLIFILLSLILLFFIKNYKLIKQNINKIDLLLITILILVSFFLRLYISISGPEVFWDEIRRENYIYNIKNTNQYFSCDLGDLNNCNIKSLFGLWPGGTSLIYSLGLLFFEGLSIYDITLFFSILTIVLLYIYIKIYLEIRLKEIKKLKKVFNSNKISLISFLGSFFLVITPAHIRLSRSSSQIILGLFFLILSFIFFEVYLNKKTKLSLFILFFSLAYLANCRTEFIFFPFIISFYLFFKDRDLNLKFLKFQKINPSKFYVVMFKFLRYLFVLFLINIPAILILLYDKFVNRPPGWNQSFSELLKNLGINLSSNITFFISSSFSPIFISLIAMLSLLFLNSNKKRSLFYRIIFIFYLLFISLYYEGNFLLLRDSSRYSLTLSFFLFIEAINFIVFDSRKLYLNIKKRFRDEKLSLFNIVSLKFTYNLFLGSFYFLIIILLSLNLIYIYNLNYSNNTEMYQNVYFNLKNLNFESEKDFINILNNSKYQTYPLVSYIPEFLINELNKEVIDLSVFGDLLKNFFYFDSFLLYDAGFGIKLLPSYNFKSFYNIKIIAKSTKFKLTPDYESKIYLFELKDNLSLENYTILYSLDDLRNNSFFLEHLKYT